MKNVAPLLVLALLFAGCTVAAQPHFVVSVYDAEKAYDGTTFFTDDQDFRHLKVFEVNMQGEIVWQYEVPSKWVKERPVGFDAERLSTGNVLLTISDSGVYEVDAEGNLVWSYEDPKVSHDADRLPNGNTLVNFGKLDSPEDAQVKEISPAGEVVWQWRAGDIYGERFKDADREGGWSHANAVERLSDGNTLVSLRNFYLTAVVNPLGEVVQEFDWSSFGYRVDPHEPEWHEDDGTLLVCLQNGSPYVAVSVDRTTQEVLWTYVNENLRTARDCNRLPNGNVLIVAVDTAGTKEDQSDDVSSILEVTRAGEIVWRLDLEDAPAQHSPGFFFKATRFIQP